MWKVQQRFAGNWRTVDTYKTKALADSAVRRLKRLDRNIFVPTKWRVVESK